MQKNMLAVAALFGLSAGTAAAQTVFETEIDTTELRAVPVAMPSPAFPGGVRTGQEGWVRVDFVVTRDGRATDPVILDSVGGEPFEQAALDTIEDWRFETPEDGAELGNNIAEMRFEVRRGRDLATSNFLRRYRRIMTHVHNEETGKARARLDEAYALGGWNLYEETMLALMSGRVEDQEGNGFGKLKHYRRALAVDDHKAVAGKDRRDLLRRIFEVEHETGQYTAALATAERLGAEAGSKADLEAIAPALAAIRETLESDAALIARGRLGTACDCEAGKPLWYYRPTRRDFEFAESEGALTNFEARCDSSRLQSPIETGASYSLPANAENCRLFVFGDAGASVELIEPGDAASDAQAHLSR